MRATARSISFLFLILTIPFLSGCCWQYTLKDASVSDDIKSVSIKRFPTFAPLAKPTLSQTFTEALRDIFLQQTRLSLVQEGGDIQYEGEITGYVTGPVAIQGNETAALNRLTITVNVRFVNTLDETQNFEASFSRFADYDSSQNLQDVEDDLIQEINDQLVQDIFNRAFSNW